MDFAYHSADVKRQLNCLHNLATAYWWEGNNNEARQRSEDGLRKAQKTEDSLNQAQFQRVLGWCEFRDNCYPQAISFYKQAYNHFHQVSHSPVSPYEAEKHREYVGAICHDLAEAYLYGVLDIMQARRWWQEGMSLAQAQNNKGHQKALKYLKQSFLELDIDVNEKQVKIIRSLRKDGKLKVHGLAELLDMSKEATLRYLKVLIEKGIVARVGKGRATYYILARRS